MGLSLLFAVSLAVAVFVGVNIGGSSTGVAFGPATGSGVISMRQAAALMATFVLIGGFTVGTRVVKTLGTEFVKPSAFTLRASVLLLALIGLSILLGNVFKVSVSTSETAVGGVVGMGAALGILDWSVVGHVVKWWLVSAVVAFWVSALIGRYLYQHLRARIDLEATEQKQATDILVVGIGCYMAFSAGASNVANAVAPLVGSGQIGMTSGVAMGALAIGAGAFLLGHRTMETIGEGITELPVEAALVVEVIAASVITGLSMAGIPASLAVTATTCVIGLGWGRASRRRPSEKTVDTPLEGKDPEEWRAERYDLHKPDVVKRIFSTWAATPTIAGILAFLVFRGALFLNVL